MLRRYCQISAFEAEHVIPAWEREMLLRCHIKVVEGEVEVAAEPLSDVPEEFAGG